MTENGYETDPKKVKAIVNAPVPTNITEVNLLWEWCNFTVVLSKILLSIFAAPLYDLTKKNVKFIWSNKAKKAFEILKSKITDKVVLSKFDSESTVLW